MVSLQVLCLAVLASCIMQCCGVPQVRCSKTATTLTMTIRVAKDAANDQLVGIDPSTYAVGTCLSTEVTVSGTVYLQIEVTTDNTRTQTVPNPTTNDCHVVDGTASTAVDYTIVGQSDPTTIQGTDVKYTTSCDSATASGIFQDISQAGILVGAGLSATAVTATSASATFELLKADDTAVSGAVTVGELYKFKITFARAADAAFVLGAKYQIDASPDNTFTSSIAMLNNEGCIPSGTTSFVLGAPVTISPTPDPAITTAVIGTTGTFSMSAFLASVDVHFRLTFYAICYAASESECFDPATYCASLSGRRKRSASQPTNGTLDLTVNVSFEGGSASNLGGKNDDNMMKKEECDAQTSFWIVSIVLGVLLLIVLAFSVILYFRLRREEKNKTVDNGSKFGVHNPGF